MCRLFGLVAPAPVLVSELHDAPRSLRTLSLEHADGWGIAAHAGGDWQIQRSVACAAECGEFDGLRGLQAQLVIAHVRKKTVGPTSLANTHPFRSGRFVFAHNGTVRDVAALAPRTAPELLAGIAGDTDSE